MKHGERRGHQQEGKIITIFHQGGPASSCQYRGWSVRTVLEFWSIHIHAFTGQT